MVSDHPQYIQHVHISTTHYQIQIPTMGVGTIILAENHTHTYTQTHFYHVENTEHCSLFYLLSTLLELIESISST